MVVGGKVSFIIYVQQEKEKEKRKSFLRKRSVPTKIPPGEKEILSGLLT